MTITPRLESDRSWAQVVALVVDRGHRGRGVGRDLVEHVEQRARGRGVGRDLVEHVEQRARGRGCDLVVINSARSREAAQTFYRGLGYRDRCQDHAQYVRTPDARGLRRPPTA